MTVNLKDQLKSKLRELFQFDSSDLDFGIYRIMNYKRKEIENFIEKELIAGIKEELSRICSEDREKVEKELEYITEQIVNALGKDALKEGELKKEFRETPLGKKYYEKKAILEKIKISEDLEKSIYNHLINFFSRYYEGGDFISKRRYGKKEKYCIPYNGEEVVLYWANRDQYYIKTAEYFKKYTFRHRDLTVNFRVVEAEEEKGNAKSQEKKFFVLNRKVFDFDGEKRELNIYFEYRSLSDREKEKYKHGNTVSQDKITEETIEVLEEKIPQGSLARLIFEKEGEKSVIERHLFRFTRRNTTDYFIHKDLKGFLERELDFYIKNEFLNLEDLDVLERSGYFDKLMIYLIGVRAFRKIALKIIEFLSQIENFQKKLWEKKKFVINTHYVITLDRIKEYAGEEFLEEILDTVLKNEEQLKEWEELFGIKVKRKEDLIEDNRPEGREWKKLPIDTRYFDEEFKWNLLAALSRNNDLDEILDGILIKSENWQALNLLLNKYYEKVQTIYIDPPFNKENEADYLYKVGYKDATWITMLENRITLGRELLNGKGSIFVRCDYNGNMYVRMLLNEIFGKENFRNEIIVRRGQSKAGFLKQFKKIESLAVGYDSLYWYSKFSQTRFPKIRKEAPKKEQKQGKWMNLIKAKGYERPSMTYEILGIKNDRPWMWSKERAFKAVENYNTYLEVSKNTGESLEEYWIRTGKKLEFVKREGNQILYWIPPREEILVDNNWLDITGYSSIWDFKTENSEHLLKRVIYYITDENDLILDFFLGSGTTTAVAHKLRRKWIGIEIGEHFYTVILPRMKKVLLYDKSGISKEKDVKKKYNPKSAGGFFKYHTLEQYEDALENIEFEKQDERKRELLLKLPDYFVKYMLKWETKESKTFLNIKELKDPFNYKLKIIENYRQKTVNVDLVETFNYLLGLHVKGYRVVNENGRRYVFVFGEKDGKRVAVVWRSIEGINLEKDREIVEENLRGYSPDEVYINGEALVRGFKHIEPLLKSLMFEGVER